MNRAMRFLQRLLPLCRDAIKLLGSAATLGSGFSAPRVNEPFLLQPVEPGVNRADGDILFRFIQQFFAYGHSIGAIVQPQNHQQQQVLETAEKARRLHYNCSVVVSDMRVKQYRVAGLYPLHAADIL